MRFARATVYLLPGISALVKANFGWANALTAVRLLLVGPMCWSVVAGHFALSAVIFCLAVATDLADGRVARSRGEVSRFGGLFDHSVDATFVGLSLAALAFQDVSPVIEVTAFLPPLVLASFSQYALDSRVLAGRPLRASSLGRYNGIGYFVVLGTAVIGAAISLPVGLLQPAVMGMGWLLVTTTLVSMVDRLVAYRTTPDSP